MSLDRENTGKQKWMLLGSSVNKKLKTVQNSRMHEIHSLPYLEFWKKSRQVAGQ